MTIYKLFLLACVCSSVACAGSFEESRLLGLKSVRAVPVTPEDKAYCRGVDKERSTWSTIGTIGETVGGALGVGGIATLAEEKNIGGPVLPVVLGSVGLVALGVGVVSHIVANDKSNTWVRECTDKVVP